MDKDNRTYIVMWLWGVAALLVVMVVIGAITRLTNSGLSMVEWRPLIGALPPMNDAEWSRVFALYQDSPEYQKEHFWMEIADFKQIFFWEWFHRLMGRMIGLAYGLPLAFFWLRGMVPTGYRAALLLPFILGGMQGLMGWYMVQSGLVDIPAVSHFRLAAHLGLAFFIIFALLKLIVSLKPLTPHPDRALFAHGLVGFSLLCLTIGWGAFTAGLDAGMIHNSSFPMMGDHWIPRALYAAKQPWAALINDHESVQFTHRWLAMASALTLLSLWFHGLLRGRGFVMLHALGVIVIGQFTLGLITLFTHVALAPAALHQLGGLMLFGVCTLCLEQLKMPRQPGA